MYWQLPALRRDDRLVGGLASGVGAELGLDAIVVRAGFLLLFAIGGWGAMLYAVGWFAVTLLERRSKPRVDPIPKARSDRERLFGFGLVVAGLGVLSSPLPLVPHRYLWPAAIMTLGCLMVWRRTRPGARQDRWFSWWPVAGGLALVALGLALAGRLLGDVNPTAGFAVASGAALVLIASSPWWWRLVGDLDRERQARARSDERADVAAHLHDSVLQTLSLIQRGGDAETMAALARRQERELRNWLDPQRASRTGGSLRGRLDEIASDIEAQYPVKVEIVAVGDCLVDEQLESLVAAGREAAINAAAHSGSDRVDLYLEVRTPNDAEAVVELFIRDTGTGFDQDAVANDRHGLRNSILGRMQRAGGDVVVTTAPGAGTEIELTLTQALGTRNLGTETAEHASGGTP